jgi:hypothetical protein
MRVAAIALLIGLQLIQPASAAPDDEPQIAALTTAFYRAVSDGDRDTLIRLLGGRQTAHCATVPQDERVTPSNLHFDIRADIAWVTLTEQRADGTRRVATLIFQKANGAWTIFAQL